MKHESSQMKLHDVYDEVDASTVDDNVIKEAIPTRWAHRKKGPGVRSRIVAKGYTEKIEDEDSVYGSVHDATNTSRTTNVTTKLDRATRRRLYGISTRTHRKGPRRQTTRRLPLARTLSTTEQTMAAKESHVGKLERLAYTRPDIAYATKEPARYTKHYKFTTEPTTTLRANTNNILDLDVHVDAGWAGCPTTRKSTSGFNIIFLGTTVAFGSRTQATIALSSAESELYAICTGVNEELHLRNFLLETNMCSKLNLRIHTDSTAGKSIATPQGTSKTSKEHRPQIFSTHKTSSNTTSSESLRSTHFTTAQMCLPST